MHAKPNSPTTAASDNTEPVTRWIGEHARPLNSLVLEASLGDLEPLRGMVGDATVVALGSSTRGSHEQSALQCRLLRFLVEELGFRCLAVEEERAKIHALDEYVRTGEGDPAELLAGTRPFWRTEEFLAAVRLLRSHNEAHPDDLVRIVGLNEDAARATSNDSLDHIEWNLADSVIRWQRRTGDRIVYWGGMAHTVDGSPRSASAPPFPLQTQHNAGSYLRRHFAAGYLSIGLTFHHGFLNSHHESYPYSVPAPPPEFAEAVLDGVVTDSFLLDLRGEQPEQVGEWLNVQARTRLIGPSYDADDDAAYHLSGGSFAEWFDVIAHVRRTTPTRPLK